VDREQVCPGSVLVALMAYRRTDTVLRRLTARHRGIIAAARGLASESGMGTVQMAPVAERASRPEPFIAIFRPRSILCGRW
jgi:hypothetical protein